VAIILNITEDHLDYHESFEDYFKIKNSIFNNAKIKIANEANKVRISNADVFFNSNDLDIDEQNLNAIEAILVALNLGINFRESLTTYSKLEHRFENFHQDEKGRIFINDSKATNIGAAVEAVKTAKKLGEVCILSGGRGKGANFNEFSNFLSENCKNIILFGEDKNLIKKNINKKKLFEVDTLKEAVLVAKKITLSNEVILFSPACSSFDAFSNFEERGDAFKKIVLNE
jgi:UDP-N-acetylmuramoylalanine--D-glutamate ligase